MVDRIARDKYAELIRHFCAGLLTNDEYEARTYTIIGDSDDKALFEVYLAVWGYYDDLHTHRMTGGYRLRRDDRRRVAQCVLFLQSDAEYLWPEHNCRFRAPLAAWPLLAVGAVLLPFAWIAPKLVSVALSPLVALMRLCDRLSDRNGVTDRWPFLHLSELDEARRHPRLLNGG